MEFLNEKNLFHIPDLDFSRYCKNEYHVNRGIYNTVDEWFFKQGLTRIVERRKTIIDFFDYIKTIQNSSRVTIGNGGLTKKLIQFWEIRENQFVTLNR